MEVLHKISICIVLLVPKFRDHNESSRFKLRSNITTFQEMKALFIIGFTSLHLQIMVSTFSLKNNERIGDSCKNKHVKSSLVISRSSTHVHVGLTIN